MREVVIVEAVRTPVGKRNGALANVHANDLLGTVQRAVVERADIDPTAVGQVVGGCVQQLGMQSGNVARNAWLSAGLPLTVPATTVNVQCGSSQQATTLAHALLAGGLVDVALACGVETMSGIPMGSTTKDDVLGLPRAGTYAEQYEATTQFQGADRIAHTWGISRFDTEVFAKRSQDLAATAWAEGRFDGQIVPVAGLEPIRACERRRWRRCPGCAPTSPIPTPCTPPGPPRRSPMVRPLCCWRQRSGPQTLGLRPRARARRLGTRRQRPGAHAHRADARRPELLLERTGLRLSDIDLFEVNEAFASVVLAWAKETGADLERTTPTEVPSPSGTRWAAPAASC